VSPKETLKQTSKQRKRQEPIAEDSEIDEECDGLRRSKRTRLQPNQIPQYKMECMLDYAGKKVMIKTMVSTKQKPVFYDVDFVFSNKQKVQRNSPKKRKEVAVAVAAAAASKRRRENVANNHEIEHADNDNNNDNDGFAGEQRDALEDVQARIDNLLPQVERNGDQAASDEESLVLGEDVDLNSQVNRSQDVIPAIDKDRQSLAKERNLYIFAKNAEHRKFEADNEAPGVSFAPISELEGMIQIDPNSVTRTMNHQYDSIFCVQVGECYVSIAGALSRHGMADIIKISKGEFNVLLFR
jgi:hypothetical protein